MERTHVKRIVFSHFAYELPANPGTKLGPAILVEPPEPLYRLDDPLAFTLFREYISEPRIVRGTPKRKIQEEKNLAWRGRQGIEKRELERKEAKVDKIDVRFWVGGMEECGDHIVRRRDAEHCPCG
jgi:hypothetical protein